MISATILKIGTFIISVICFVLLVCATAGDYWLTDDGGKYSVGLWRFCMNNQPCSDDKAFDWFDGVRAFCVLSTMAGALAVLFASTPVFLPIDHKLRTLSHPYTVAILLAVAGSFMIAASRSFADKLDLAFYLVHPDLSMGSTIWMALGSGITSMLIGFAVIISFFCCSCYDDAYTSF